MKLKMKEQVQAVERHMIRQALEATRGDVSAAAKELDTPLRTLWHKLSRYSISPDDYRRIAPYGQEDAE